MKLGIKKISVTEQKNISLPLSKENESVTLNDSLTWVQLPTTNISGTLEESTEKNENGTLRTVKIKATIVDKSGEIRKSLRTLEESHIFKIEDMNGIEYLVGTNMFRSQLTYRAEINQLGKNSYAIEIKHQSPHGALKILKPTPGHLRSYLEILPNQDLTGSASVTFPKIQTLVSSYKTSENIKSEQLSVTAEHSEWVSVTLTFIDPIYSTNIGQCNIRVTIIAEINYGQRRDGYIIFRQQETGKAIGFPLFQETTPTADRIGFYYDDQNNFLTTDQKSYDQYEHDYAINVLSTYNKQHNHPFSYSGPEWITASINQNYNRVTFHLTRNTTGSKREATITLIQQDSNLTCTCKFIQQ